MPPPRKRGRNIAIIAGAVVAVIAVLAVIGAVAGSTKKGNSSTTPNEGAATPAPRTAGTPAGYTNYSSAVDGFHIAIPDTWKAVDPQNAGAQAAMNEVERDNPKLNTGQMKSAIQLAQAGTVVWAVNPTPGTGGFNSNVAVLAKPDVTFSDSDLSVLEASLPAQYAKIGITITNTNITTLDGLSALQVETVFHINTPLGTPISVDETQYFLGANGFLFVINLAGDSPDLSTIASTFATG
jgi:hypothetical protein